jgi:antitoxin MazE
MAIQEARMKIQVSKWGNSLAVRLPADYARTAGLREGDMVEADVSPNGAMTIVPDQAFDKQAFLRRARRLRSGMKMAAPTVEAMRREDRY